MTDGNEEHSEGGNGAPEPYDDLIERVHELANLNGVVEMLEWDMETYMPPKAHGDRGQQLATVQGTRHERFIDPQLGSYLDALQEESVNAQLDDAQRANVRAFGRDYERAVKLPSELVRELAKTKSTAIEAWLRAKKASDFSIFAPLLEKTFALKQRVAECIGYEEAPYDAHLDEYEPNMTIAELKPLFNDLRAKLVPIVETLVDAEFDPDLSVLRQPCPVPEQREFVTMLSRAMGYDYERGRLDETEHPFTIGANDDVRITTHYYEENIASAIFSTIHEAGHGLYQQGFLREHFRTPMAEPISLGIHESQSRLWENIIGRSERFWHHYYPKLQETFPSQFREVPLRDFHAAINHVEPSLIRIEADEVTYNLHILVRFDIERMLFEGEVEIQETPQVWNELMEKYLGITPPNDAKGVLQDVHWPTGLFGYFPTYALGNLYSVQFYNTAREEIDGLDAKIAAGELLPLKQWLNEHIHHPARMYFPNDLCERVTGQRLSTDPFIEYLKEKYSGIYGITL